MDLKRILGLLFGGYSSGTTATLSSISFRELIAMNLLAFLKTPMGCPRLLGGLHVVQACFRVSSAIEYHIQTLYFLFTSFSPCDPANKN